jgi:polyhydroxyalkanoate synthesis regulator phasin
MWALRDAARELQIDPKTLTRYLDQLGIEPRKVGVRKLITDADIARLRTELMPKANTEIDELRKRLDELERRVQTLERKGRV